jgi:hypothetical protein
VVHALLEADLQGVVPGVGAEIRQALEGSGELRIRIQQVRQRNGGLIVE